MKPLAVITGASSGIGRAYAAELIKSHDLLLVARRGELLRDLKLELSGPGKHIDWVAADLACEKDLAAFESLLRDKRVDILVNAAGFGDPGAFSQSRISTIQEMTFLHVDATTRLCRLVLDGMLERDHGFMINVASVSGFSRVLAGNIVYDATKAYLIRFSELLQQSLGRDSNIRIQALCPGFTRTGFHSGHENVPRIPAFLWMNPAEVVNVSLSALTKKSTIVIPGWYNVLIARIISQENFSSLPYYFSRLKSTLSHLKIQPHNLLKTGVAKTVILALFCMLSAFNPGAGYKSGPHHSLGEQNCALSPFVSYDFGPKEEAPSTEWKFMKEYDKIFLFERWVKVSEDFSARERRGEMQIQCSMETAINTITKNENLARWMKGVSENTILERKSQAEWTTYSIFDFPWPFRNRDLVAAYQLNAINPASYVQISINSLDNTLKSKAGLQRIRSYRAKWVIRKVNETTISLSFTVFSAEPPVVPRRIQDPIVEKTFLQSLGKLREIMQ